MTVRFRPWALTIGTKASWQRQGPLVSENFGKTGRSRMKSLILAACLVLPIAATAGDGMKYQDHWRSLGVSAIDIELIDKLDMKKKKVEALVTRGVSVREYSHRPWEPMGITEDRWFDQLQNGSNIGQLERMYTRQNDVVDPVRPNILVAIVAPGLPQFKEDRPVAGAVLSGLGVAFLALSVKSIVKDDASGAVQVWLPLLAVDMMASGADVWYHHYREQAVTGFSLNLQPRTTGLGLALAARF
ncbi:MAG: hypothetical protein RL173_2775 [Fibrobacterota bacterium]|jgi:hypothetical protein